MQRLTVRLFGGFEVRVGLGPPLRLPTRKTQALLAYLAAHLGQPQARDKLAGLLWGSSSDRQARQSLRQALYWARRAVADGGGPADAFSEGDGVALVAAATEVDVVAFEDAIAAGDAASLDRAIALYRGTLLDGLAATESPFEDWLHLERARLREAAITTLGRRFAQHEQAGAIEAAIHCADRQLALDPLQEPVHRTVMRLHALGGRRAAALRQYQICADALRRELGADPEPETQALHQALLRGGDESTADRGRPRRTPPAAPPIPLVGRRAELAQLHDAVRQAALGPFHAVALVGEAGAGKTRLLDQMIGETGNGARVLVGHAHEMGQDLPFAPVIDALRAGLGRGDVAAVGDLTPVLQDHLHRLLPELWVAGGALPAAEDRPQALFEAVAQWFERLAAETPLLLVLEDVHWADDATVRLLSFLAHRLATLPLLLVLSAREEELAETGAPGRLLQELSIKRRLTTIRVPRLDGTATSALVRALGRQRLPRSTLARLAPRVWRQSEGNPFMIVELVHAALESGNGQRAWARSLPERVQALIGGRLERLSDNGRRMVDVAATLGGTFAFDLVQRASGLAPPAAAEALDELVRRRILMATEGALTFSHDQIRAVAYARLLPGGRQMLHRAVAEALEAGVGHRAADLDDRLAYHFARAGEVEQATTCLLRAAGTARHRYALDVTLKLLDEALRHINASSSDGHERRRLDVMLRKAQILSIFGRFQEVIALLLPHRPRLEALRNPALEGPYYARLALTFAQIGSHARAELEARKALACADRSADDGVRAHAHYVFGVRGYFSGNTREGVEHAGQAAALYERIGQRGMAGLACWILGLNHYLRGEFAEALAAETQAAAIAEALGESALASRAAWSIALVELTRGEGEVAIAAAERALEQAASHPANRATALALRGRARLEAGDVDAAVADLEQAFTSLSSFDVARAITATYLAEARLAQGDHQVARTMATTARDLATERECPWAVAGARQCLAAIALAAGARAEAQAELLAALEVFDRQEARFEAARTRLDLAAMLHAQGGHAEAAAHVTAARDMLDRLDAPMFQARARRQAALCGVAEIAGTTRRGGGAA